MSSVFLNLFPPIFETRSLIGSGAHLSKQQAPGLKVQTTPGFSHPCRGSKLRSSSLGVLDFTESSPHPQCVCFSCFLFFCCQLCLGLRAENMYVPSVQLVGSKLILLNIEKLLTDSRHECTHSIHALYLPCSTNMARETVVKIQRDRLSYLYPVHQRKRQGLSQLVPGSIAFVVL